MRPAFCFEVLATLAVGITIIACSGTETPAEDGASGGASSGTAGMPSGGTPSLGGAGGSSSGGASGGALGGTPSGGASGTGPTGGNAGSGEGGMAGTGAGVGGSLGGGGSGAGAASGGAGAGPGGAGGKGGGGTGGGWSIKATFAIGADITDQEPQPVATRQNLLNQMQLHGFNFIRLRTFVDPRAADGYDKQNGYADIDHTVAFGKQIKDTEMGLLVDFHYSDNWADPGKQCVPIAWQSFTTIAQLATAVHDYTKDAIQKLVAGGARPDMVQIGNETTPGMLIHRCDSGGQPTGNNPVTGSTSNWTNLGMLLKAGANAVLEVDPSIVVSLHIDRGNSFSATKYYIDNAVAQGVPFTAFGESTYQRYQGVPDDAPATVAGWTTTFAQLSAAYPNIKFFSAEYGPLELEINKVLWELPNNQGIGTFNWAPTTRGDWNTGHDLLRRSGSTYAEQPDLALYDQMKMAYMSRL